MAKIVLLWYGSGKYGGDYGAAKTLRRSVCQAHPTAPVLRPHPASMPRDIHRDKNSSGTLVSFKYIIALAMNYDELL